MIAQQSGINLSLPFDEPVPAPKSRKHRQHRSTDASLHSFEQIKTRQNKAFRLTLRLLTEFECQTPEHNLTAREILRLLKARGEVSPNAERNYVSPRLTELLELGCVENPVVEGSSEIYLKRVEGDAAASVWRITSRGRELLSCLETLEQEVKK